ncbi:unnamed protein product [Thelazia callipaeda]|uniref:Peptidase A1 domain-containing protein n=1 Tax=Thelazia callipaeda TaxID=103827 RepID=A0A0N5D939_THECL|nr:unnamed protein product [Thelazia callipaeda]
MPILRLSLLVVAVAFLSLTQCEYRMLLSPVYNNIKHHTGYTLQISIGSPSKNFNVLLDTVTSLFWVAGTHCQSEFCNGKVQYPTPASNAISASRRYCFYSKYRRVMTYEWHDDIVLEQYDGLTMKFVNASFGTPFFLEWPEWREYNKIDGVMGLASLNIEDTLKDSPVMQVLRDIVPIFTIALAPLNTEIGPSITISAVDTVSCDIRKLSSEKLISLGARYDFKYLSISMGNVSFSSPSRKAFAYPHIIKSYIGVPDDFMQAIVQKYNAKIDPSTGIYWVDCNASFDSFTLTTVNNTYVLEAKYFIIKHDASNEKCELAFRNRKGSVGPVSLGIPFLHKYCAVFKPAVKTIDFYPLKNNFIYEINN